MDEGTSSTAPIPVPANNQPPWKDTKLSLERPYNDAKGAPVRRVYDIDDTGGWVYENPKVYDEQLGVQLQRIFEERGTTIWEDYSPEWVDSVEDEQKENITEEEESGEEGEGDDGDEAIGAKKKPMTIAELQKLRENVIPNLLYVLLEGF
jgi:mediator of RNA polymerase II transcription subunit 17